MARRPAETSPDPTRERVMAAAAELFAEKGFRGATMRAIAARAGANLASAHYHFGSKQKLYLEVFSELFTGLEKRLAELGLSPEEGALGRLSRAELAELLRARMETLLEFVLAQPGHHATLMMHELAEPGPALQHVVRRFIDPMRRAMEAIVRYLAPELTPEQAETCVRSIAGQLFFYRSHRPALLQMMGRRAYPKGFEKEVAAHVLRFSLGGIDRLAGKDTPCAAAS